jgi:hypothetical protein
VAVGEGSLRRADGEGSLRGADAEGRGQLRSALPGDRGKSESGSRAAHVVPKIENLLSMNWRWFFGWVSGYATQAAGGHRNPDGFQAAGSWKCQMTSDGRRSAARTSDGR